MSSAAATERIGLHGAPGGRWVAGSPLLEVESLSKTFVGQVALDRVSLTVAPGEVHGLVGQNGSGKSTLIKVLAGYHDADPGSVIKLGGRNHEVQPLADRHDRIHVMHQDLGLIPSLSAIENLALGRGFKRSSGRRIAWRAEAARAVELLAAFDVELDPRAPVASLSPADRAILCLARASQDWEDPESLLILDEPTVALPQTEVERLFAAVRRLAERGAGILFVSHRLEEVFAITDAVTVLRDGRSVGTFDTASLDQNRLVELIVGRPLEQLYVAPPEPSTDVVVEVERLAGPVLDGLSFSLHRGEVLGVTGLTGSGRNELPGLLVGQYPACGGRVLVDGEPLRLNPRAVKSRGVAFVPADRKRHGSILNQSVEANIVLTDFDKLFRRGWLGRRATRTEGRKWIADLDIRPGDPDRALALLSGGNQQKTVLAKWLRTVPKVIILDEPTQGVDVGSKAAIYQVLADAAEAGAAVLVCSSDAEELANICDRVIVLRSGRSVGTLSGDHLTPHSILERSL